MNGQPKGPVRYYRVPRSYTPEELSSSEKLCIATGRTRYSLLRAEFPGSGDRHHVAWANKCGDVHVDRLVSLFPMPDKKVKLMCLLRHSAAAHLPFT